MVIKENDSHDSKLIIYLPFLLNFTNLEVLINYNFLLRNFVSY